MVWFIIAGNKMKYAVQTYSVESVFFKLLLLAVSPHDTETSIAIIGEPNLRPAVDQGILTRLRTRTWQPSRKCATCSLDNCVPAKW